MSLPGADLSGRHRREDERGISLIELMITMSLVVTVLSLVLPDLVRVFGVVGGQSTRVQAQDLAQAALTQIQRDLRSGSVMAGPNPVDGATGMDIVLATNAYGADECVEYAVLEGQLRRRTRARGVGSVWPTDWSVVADKVVNTAQSPQVEAFAKQGESLSLTVDLVVDAGAKAVPVRLTSTVTGREAAYREGPIAEADCG